MQKYRIPVAVMQCSPALVYRAEDCEEPNDGLLILSSYLIMGIFEGAGMEEQLFFWWYWGI